MKNYCDEDGVRLFWLSCDHCEDVTIECHSRYDLAMIAIATGWRHNKVLGKDFCCLTCELAYLAKHVEKGERND